MIDDRKRRFKGWMSRPPRPHGQVLPDRTVSFLELFYDLVYVAVIAQAAHHLAEDVTARTIAEFALIFAMIWIAWIHGSLYVELHGRDDGRTRSLVFIQMGLLAWLAVFTADAAGETGVPFALVYAAFMAVQTWQWNEVRRQDPDRFMVVTGRYSAGMLVLTVALVASAFLPDDARLVAWAGFVAAWIIAIVSVGRSEVGLSAGITPTDSLVERFGLFTIIVLGEVIFGVVDGLSVAEPVASTIATGILAIILGFGFWFIYFDVVGRRLPRADERSLVAWLLSHLPVTLSIAAAGAGLASLIAQAQAPTTPATTAWLLAGSVALGLLALVVTERALVDADRLRGVYRPLGLAMAAGAAAAIIVGLARPAPWLLVGLLVAILSVLWFFAVFRFLGVDAWGDTPRPDDA